MALKLPMLPTRLYLRGTKVYSVERPVYVLKIGRKGTTTSLLSNAWHLAGAGGCFPDSENVTRAAHCLIGWCYKIICLTNIGHRERTARAGLKSSHHFHARSGILLKRPALNVFEWSSRCTVRYAIGHTVITGHFYWNSLTIRRRN